MLKQAIKILFQANNSRKTIVREIEIFRRLMDKLDNPQHSFRSIHITGTNGKGSVALKTAYILQKAGYRTGLYTSPHLFSFLERIRVNRQSIDEQYFSQSILKIKDIALKNNLDLTFFEYLTASGFMYFKHQKCDFASIEVGLGGRYDTTNILQPEVSVITSIGIDHQKLLGGTRQLIAKDKAGIIKQNTPIVVGPRANLPPIIQEAKSKKASLFITQEKADFQQENNEVTRKVIQVLKQKGLNIGNSHVQEGLLIRQSCRMEQLPKNLLPKWAAHKRVFFDVAHNAHAIERMLEYYQKNIKKEGDQLMVLFGTSKEKNFMSALKKIQEKARMIFLLQANHFRAMSVDQLSEYVAYSKYPTKFQILDDGKISTTIQFALAEQSITNVIVCGSFFLMPQAWGLFDKKYLNQEHNMQEQYAMKNK